MLKFFASVYEVGKDLVEILTALGELGFFLGKLYYKLACVIKYIFSLPWPQNIIVASPIIIISFFFREILVWLKLVGLMVLGLWIYFKMSVKAVRYFGLTLAGIGLLLFVLNMLILKGVIKLPFLFPKKNEKKGKKEKN